VAISISSKYQPKPQSSAFEAQTSGLVVKDLRQMNDAFGASFIGTVRNSGPQKWEGVWVEVDLFDANGKILDVCTELLDRIFLPQSDAHFRVLCYDSAKDRKPTHTTYKAHISMATKTNG
jgi:hypothetical protein